jgi:hypothetical protein
MFTDKPWENLGKPGRVGLTLLPFTSLVKCEKMERETEMSRAHSSGLVNLNSFLDRSKLMRC